MREKTGRFKRSDRLRDSRDYRRIMRRGRRQSDSELVIITTRKWEKPISSGHLGESEARSSEAGSRLGITASRKVGGAVVRNRFKRRVREWFRVRRHQLAGNQDLVVLAKPSAGALSSLSMEQLDQRLSRLAGISADPLESEWNPLG
jgi:ribonuclease P protein component